jgi:hypothetical protein
LFPIAIAQVGDGRGFLVNGENDRCYVITAAHCLPQDRYPFPHLSSAELALPNIVGPLGCSEQKLLRTEIPVTFPPGRFKLATNPTTTGSKPVMNMIGIDVVAAFAAEIAGSEPAKITLRFACRSDG